MKRTVLCLVLLTVSFTNAQEQVSPIHVEVTGKGEPLLLIPGFTVPGDSWEPVVKHLENEFECHVVTLAGFGGKDAIDFPWLPKITSALQNYMEQHHLKNVTVIGHSLGGTIGLWLASRYGNPIANLVIIDALPATGALMIPDFDPEKLSYDSPYNNQLLAMDTIQFNQMASNMAKGMSLDAPSQQKIKDWIIKADRETYVYGYTDYLKLDMRDDLKKISIPVNILAADRPYGKDMVKATYTKQYQNLTDYNIFIAENAAHFVMFDQPEWFMKKIKHILLTDPSAK
nr:alpha/beta hydrolase [uncultured Allomuricauda sp.]